MLGVLFAASLAGCSTTRSVVAPRPTADIRALYEISPDVLATERSARHRSELNLIKAMRNHLQGDKDADLAYLDHLEKGVRTSADGSTELLRQIGIHFQEGDRLFLYEARTKEKIEDGWIIFDNREREKHRIVLGESKPVGNEE